MSKWGIFHVEDEIHVAPCDDDGELIGDHELEPKCKCKPVKTRYRHKTLYIHEDPERGGYNS